MAVARAKNVCLVNGSLRGKKASSLAFLRDVSHALDTSKCGKTCIRVLGSAVQGYPEETLRHMAEADALVLVFPLYAYGLPGALMRLLEDFYRHVEAGNEYNRQTRVYAIVNCGFPRPELTTGEAVRVVRNFCRRLHLKWRFAVCIGTGPVVALTRKVPFLDYKLKRAITEIASDIIDEADEPKDDRFVRPIIPESIIRRIKEYYERKGEMMQLRNQPTRSGSAEGGASSHLRQGR